MRCVRFSDVSSSTHSAAARRVKLPRQEPQARIIRRAAIFLSSACRRNRFFRARSGRIEIESLQKFVLYRHGRKVRLQMNTNAVSQVLATKKMLVGPVARAKSPTLEKLGAFTFRATDW